MRRSSSNIKDFIKINGGVLSNLRNLMGAQFSDKRKIAIGIKNSRKAILVND